MTFATEKRDRQHILRLTVREKAALKAAAEKAEISESELVRRALDLYLAEEAASAATKGAA